MADEIVMKKDLKVEHDAVDVFTHSSTAFPGAWTEEEISTLLDTWQDVVERTRSTTRRFNVAQRILKSYRAKGLEDVTIDVIRKQLKKLRTEYKVYQGLLKIGIKAHRAPCVDQLELILETIPSSRRRIYLPARGGSRNRAYSDDVDRESNRNTSKFSPEEVTSDQEATPKPRVRFQRVNVQLQQRLIKVMDQQQFVMDRLERLFKSFEASNDKMLNLLDTLISLQKPSLVKEDIPQIVVQDVDDKAA